MIGIDANSTYAAYAAQMSCGANAPKPASPHSSAMEELESRVDSVGLAIQNLLGKLDSVSYPIETKDNLPSPSAIPPASPVPSVAHANRLSTRLELHIAKIEDALSRLAI